MVGQCYDRSMKDYGVLLVLLILVNFEEIINFSINWIALYHVGHWIRDSLTCLSVCL